MAWVLLKKVFQVFRLWIANRTIRLNRWSPLLPFESVRVSVSVIWKGISFILPPLIFILSSLLLLIANCITVYKPSLYTSLVVVIMADASMTDVSIGTSIGHTDEKFEQFYTIDRKLRSGSYGTVFVTKQNSTGKEFAVKVIDRTWVLTALLLCVLDVDSRRRRRNARA